MWGVGFQALLNNTSGDSGNTALGEDAGINLMTGSNFLEASERI
jgi:hypothetical protein